MAMRLLMPPIAVATLSACALTGGTSDYPVTYMDWGVERSTGTTSAELTNIVQQLAPFDEDDGTFAYLTGAEAGVDSDALAEAARGTTAPERIIAEAVAGAVTVRIRADRGTVPERPHAHAASAATAIHRLTTEIWPDDAVGVVVDMHVMPDDAVFSLARRVEWREGDAFRLAVFRPVSSAADSASIHELYHVLAARWSIGRRDVRAAARPNVASAYEEIAASLFSDCGMLLASGRLARPNPQISGVLDGRRIEHPMSPDDLAYVLGLLGRLDGLALQTKPGTQFGLLLAPIPVLDTFGDSELVTVDSAEGQRLLSLCREISPDPWRLEAWFSRFQGEGPGSTPADRNRTR
jgi:hypothetical protein